MGRSEQHSWRARTAGALLAVAAVAALAAACGSGTVGRPGPQTGKTLASAVHEPAACRGLKPVTTASEGSIPTYNGTLMVATGESFVTWSPGAPYLVATLDDRGLHFSPGSLAAGVYNVCFLDQRSHRTAHDDAVLDFMFVGGPLLEGFSVHAGTIGASQLCPVLDSPAVIIRDKPVNVPYSAPSISYGDGCPTVVT